MKILLYETETRASSIKLDYYTYAKCGVPVIMMSLSLSFISFFQSIIFTPGLGGQVYVAMQTMLHTVDILIMHNMIMHKSACV